MHQAVRTVMAEDGYMYPLRPNYSLIIDCFHRKLTLNSHLKPQYIQEQVQHAETLIHFKYIKQPRIIPGAASFPFGLFTIYNDI